MPTDREPISVDQAEAPLFVGVDVGGTGIKIGLVDDRGRTLGDTRIDTQPQKGADDAVARTAAAMAGLLRSYGLTMEDVAAVGLGTPGTMDIPAGMILEPPNLPAWRNFPIRDQLSAACGRPVSYANDAGAAAYGEFWVGSGQAFHSIVLLTLGTGVGGGIIIGEMSLDGENSHGGECGHIIIDSGRDARLCSCGQPGHLEAYASATALVRRTVEALQTGRPSSLSCVPDQQTLNGLLIAQHAERGDELALEMILGTADYLSIGIVSLIHTIDPGAVILGGAMNFGGHDTDLGRRFLQRVREQVRGKIFPVLAQRTVIDFASLGGDAGYIGAAGIARAAFRK